jgi:hypothetical protein
MAKVSQLGERIKRLASLDEEALIYAAEPWNNESVAVVAMEPESGALPKVAARHGLKYFLEVFTARDILEGWESNLGRKPTDEERCDRLIRYAIDDA